MNNIQQQYSISCNVQFIKKVLMKVFKYSVLYLWTKAKRLISWRTAKFIHSQEPHPNFYYMQALLNWLAFGGWMILSTMFIALMTMKTNEATWTECNSINTDILNIILDMEAKSTHSLQHNGSKLQIT